MSTTKIPDELLSSGVGTGASNLVELDSSGKLPAVDGSALTGVAPTKATIDALGIAASSITGALPAIDGGNLTNLNIPAAFDPEPLVKSIAVLALRDSVNQNLAYYNLNNSFIDTFQDTSGVSTTTDVSREGEYYRTKAFDAPVYYRMNANTSQSSGTTVNFTNGTGAWESGGSSFDYVDLTTTARGSGHFTMGADSTYQLGGRYTIIQQVIVHGNDGSGGPSFSYGFNKNDNDNDTGTPWPGYMNNYWGHGNTFTAAWGTAGYQIKTIYDPSTNEDLITSYKRNSNSASWGTTSFAEYRSQWNATTISTLYHAGTGWTDSGSHWKVRIWNSYEANSSSTTGNITSVTTTTSETISSASLVLTYNDYSGTATLNTDIKGYVSSNGGTNWTQVTLVSGAAFSTGIKTASSNKTTITNTGTSMRYKIEWSNQAAGTKETFLEGISLNY